MAAGITLAYIDAYFDLGGIFDSAIYMSYFILLYGFYFLAKRYSTNPVLHLIISIFTLGYSFGVQILLFSFRNVVDPTGFVDYSDNKDVNFS